MATKYPTEQEEFGWEIEGFQKEIERLRKRNEELVAEVMSQSARASEAEEKLKRWRRTNEPHI